MIFVLVNKKAVSKHSKKESAEKKIVSLKKYNSSKSLYQSISKVKDTNKYEIVEIEKGSIVFDEYMENIDFLKEYKEKYNMDYKRSNPKEYDEFLDKMKGRK